MRMFIGAMAVAILLLAHFSGDVMAGVLTVGIGAIVAGFIIGQVGSGAFGRRLMAFGLLVLLSYAAMLGIASSLPFLLIASAIIVVVGMAFASFAPRGRHRHRRTQRW